MNELDVAHFRTFGFTVLREAFDPEKLGEETDRALVDGAAVAIGVHTGSGRTRVQYVPMMNERTPNSLELLDRFHSAAASLMGGPALPIRAKGMRYSGDTPWHTDSSRDLMSVGFAAYLEPLAADSGALRVLPGSHRGDFRDNARVHVAALGAQLTAESLSGFPIATEPGDVIAFDEHLLHASAGGTLRRQWRVDYVRDPRTADEEACVRALLAGIFPPDWDGGYDVDLFPSYGRTWLDSGRSAVTRLRELGAYQLADAQEDFVRSRRRAARGR